MRVAVEVTELHSMKKKKFPSNGTPKHPLQNNNNNNNNNTEQQA
jgi:hypothetical protein